MTTKATKDEPDLRTYEIEAAGETYRIEIPATFKVTYGTLHPGTRPGAEGLVLRIYESDTKQRAIFRDVRSFRDLSLSVLRKKKGEAQWGENGEGIVGVAPDEWEEL